jgi:Na+/melibiose symporter-like transporter
MTEHVGRSAAASAASPRAGEPVISGRRLVAFSLLTVTTGGITIPVQTYLPAFYATAIGMDLGAVGLVFMISRLTSVAIDPLIGWASDRTRTRFGRRKPWILGGGLLLLLAIFAVFFPPAHAGPVYLACWMVLLGVGTTACMTPHVAWGGEMTSTPAQQSRVLAYIGTAAAIGIFAVLVMPALLDSLGQGSPERRVGTMGLVLAGLLSLALVTILTGFREGPVRPTPSFGWGHLRQLAADGDLRRIIVSDFCVALGQGMRGAVFLFFATRYMGVAAPALLLLLQYGFGIFASPLWVRIGYRLGIVRTLIAAELAQVAVNLLLLALVPGQTGLFALLVAAQGLLQGSGNLMLRTMIFGVADRHRARDGVEVAGLLSSVFNITSNAAYAVAVGIALPLIGWLGFDPRAQGDAGLSGLHAFFALGPAAGHLLSVMVIRIGRRPERLAAG